MKLLALDHLVLTVADVARSVAFYQRVLGMRPQTFGGGRQALIFGTAGAEQKINLHPAGAEYPPHAARPTAGSADLCLRVAGPLRGVISHLEACGAAIVEGPVTRTGARLPLRSVYLRDPDGNLVELAVEQTAEQSAAGNGAT